MFDGTELTWTALKERAAAKNLPIQYIPEGTDYIIWIREDTDRFFVILSIEATPDPDTVDFETNYKSSCNQPLQSKNSRNELIFQKGLAEGSKVSFISHDYTNKCSWWQNATKVIGETLNDSGDGLTFDFANEGLIDADAISGRNKIYKDKLLDENVMQNSSFRVRFHKIYVDSVLQASGYTINHKDGTITFDSSKSGSTITADHYYATTSDYKVAPTSGKILRIYRVEVQFSQGSHLPPIKFQVWIGAAATPYVHQERTYLTAQDYLNETNLGYVIEDLLISATPENIVILPWDYPCAIDLKDSYGMYIKISAEDNTIEGGGNLMTVTFYCISEDE